MAQRPLNRQTIVITGASSGIGRETAVEAGKRGANVVLAARNEEALREAAQEVEASGGKTLVVPTDVAEQQQVERLAQATIEHFGRIDTWVNNAAVSEYATIEQIPAADVERILQVNLLGTIYGVKAALPHMKRQGEGTIINVGSVLSERAVPLQGIYVESKHAIKGLTEALRMELDHEKSGIQVTLIKPATINTPYYTSAPSRTGVRPGLVPPIYEPGVVAEAILFAAEHPRRDLFAGGMGKMMALLENISPKLMDWYMLQNGRLFEQQKSDQPDDGRSNLFAPAPGKGRSRGDWSAQARGSLYTRYLELHPNRKRLILGALALSTAALLAGRARRT